MIDPDRDLEMTLKLARRLAEPSLADGARVLSAVRSGLAGVPAASSNRTAASSDTTRVASPVRPRGAAAGKATLQGAALQQLITVGVVAAALGFAAGWGLRDRSGASDVAPREIVALPAPPNEPPSEPERSAVERRATPQESAPAPPVVLDEPAARARAHAEPAAKPRARKLTNKPAERAAPVQDSSDFFEAVNLLRRAQRAVNRGEGQVALSLLAELDTRFDGKTLGEERQATRALALCASGDVQGARRVARELERVAPSSIYAGRLRLSCAGWNGASSLERDTEPPSP